MGVILRALAFPLVTSIRSFPLLSHHLNLNKSNPSWPHPPASAFLPRGPEAPTTQAVWGGEGPALLPKRGLHTVNTCTQSRCCLRSFSRALLQHTHTCVAIRVCVPSPHEGTNHVHAHTGHMCTGSPLSVQCTCTMHRRMLGCFTMCPSEMPLCIAVTHVTPKHRT